MISIIHLLHTAATKATGYINQDKTRIHKWLQLAAAARAWNSLPCHVRDMPSLLDFRCELKTVLFRLSYPVN